MGNATRTGLPAFPPHPTGSLRLSVSSQSGAASDSVPSPPPLQPRFCSSNRWFRAVLEPKSAAQPKLAAEPRRVTSHDRVSRPD